MAQNNDLFANDPIFEDPEYIASVSRLKKQADGTYTFTGLTSDEIGNLFISYLSCPHRKPRDPLHWALQRAMADIIGERNKNQK